MHNLRKYHVNTLFKITLLLNEMFFYYCSVNWIDNICYNIISLILNFE